MTTVLSHREAMREKIINDVLRTRSIPRHLVFGPGRDRYLVEARRAIARKMREAEFSMASIARTLKRERTTIINLIDDNDFRKRRRKRFPLSRYAWMEDNTKKVILSIAKRRGIKPGELVNEWLAERAAMETTRAAA
jgi:hypothetical protein